MTFHSTSASPTFRLHADLKAFESQLEIERRQFCENSSEAADAAFPNRLFGRKSHQESVVKLELQQDPEFLIGMSKTTPIQQHESKCSDVPLLHDFLDRGRSSSLVQGMCSTTNSCQLPGGDSFSAEKAGGRTQKLGTRHLIAQLGALRHWQNGDFLSQ